MTSGVNLAASLAWHFSTQEAEVSFVVPGLGRGTDLNEFLARLAVIQPQGGVRSGKAVAAGSWLSDVLRELNSGNNSEYNIVLTARPQGSADCVMEFVLLCVSGGRVRPEELIVGCYSFLFFRFSF